MLSKRDLIMFEAGRMVGVGRPISEAVRQAWEYVNGIEGYSSFLTTNKELLEHFINKLENEDLKQRINKLENAKKEEK